MSNLRFALPSTGALFEGTSKLLSDCGLAVRRANSRRYTADIPSLPGVDVLFQRQTDITMEIELLGKYRLRVGTGNTRSIEAVLVRHGSRQSIWQHSRLAMRHLDMSGNDCRKMIHRDRKFADV